MTCHVHITRRAERDLSRALDYIEFSLKNPQAADSLLDEAERVFNSLSQMPERYALPEDKLLAAWGIRFVQVKKHLAFYVITEETQTIHVIRFHYGKSGWRSAATRQDFSSPYPGSSSGVSL